jgi:protein O-mannosyl-transferase
MAARSSGPKKKARGATRAPSVPPASTPEPAARKVIDWRKWLALSGALLVVTLFVYQPAWHGAPLWDDDGHLTQPELRSAEGLRRIWTEPGATQQYYPLAHSAFWVMHQLWGDNTTGYHLVNICLHVLSALLLTVLMQRLSLPGAWFAAFIFALHPIQVESVAWMTELKNTLSTPLYLCAALAYSRFDETKRTGHWLVAFAFFTLALLTKTVTATLPVSLLVIAWWRRGRIDWRRDVQPLLAFFALAVAAGAMTAWVEHTFIGARGAEFELTPIERVLVAGRAVWFYMASLLWPSGLVFQYPRWSISATTWWQYLFPLSLALLMVGLFSLRNRTRAPLTALLLFGSALAPALGFVNVYPFRYSFVADHFQYTASLAAIAAIAAALTGLAVPRMPAWTRAAASVLLLAPLAWLSWMHAHQYTDSETLYRTTIARNPSAWMAFHNLSVLRLHSADRDLAGALQYAEESIRIEPRNPEALNTRGYIRLELGDLEGARRDYEASINLSPAFASPHNNLGVLNYRQGRLEDAMANYREAIRLNPKDPEAQRNLGIALMDLGRTSEADPYIRRAYALNPESPDVLLNLGSLNLRENRLDEAVALFQRALALRPDFPAAQNNLGITLEKLGRLPEAERQYREVLRLDPQSAIAQDNLGYVLLQQRKFLEAVSHWTEVLKTRPTAGVAHAGRAAALEGLGRIDESIAAYREAMRFPDNAQSANVRNDFGVTLAKRGRTAEAIEQFTEALRLDPAHPDARANLMRARGK